MILDHASCSSIFKTLPAKHNDVEVKCFIIMSTYICRNKPEEISDS